MKRRDFLKLIAAALAPLPDIPVGVFVPPREPFVHMGRKGLDGLVSHLGILPSTRELSICEGKILDMEDWDGTGYPALVENVCSFGPDRPRAWIYDFDLWNFRDDDSLGCAWHLHPDAKGFNSHAAFFAARRFGNGVKETVRLGGGWLRKEFCQEAILS